MTDLIDTANAKAQAFTDEHINSVRKTLRANDITDCLDCDKPIGAARKQAVPWATRCIKCQSKLESHKKRR